MSTFLSSLGLSSSILAILIPLVPALCLAETRLDDEAEKIIYNVMEKPSSNGDEILSVLDKLVMLKKRGLLDELLKLADLLQIW